jgi:hypothetical protein
VIFFERSPFCDRGRDLGDVAHLARQVARHRVHVVGQVLPHAADLDRHRGRLPELAVGADLAGDAGDLADEPVQLVDHAVDRVLEDEHLALHVGRDLLAQVAVRHGADDALHLVAGADEVLDQGVDRLDGVAPDLVGALERHALREHALFADDPADALQFRTERLVGADDRVQAVGDLARDPGPVERHAHREVSGLDLAQDLQQDLWPKRLRLGGRGCGHDSPMTDDRGTGASASAGAEGRESGHPS